jgi:hypothetical protein
MFSTNLEEISRSIAPRGSFGANDLARRYLISRIPHKDGRLFQFDLNNLPDMDSTPMSLEAFPAIDSPDHILADKMRKASAANARAREAAVVQGLLDGKGVFDGKL